MKKNQIIKRIKVFDFFNLCLIENLCIHPTSMTVSVRLTKITGSLSLCTHMLILLFPVWAGIENDKINR